MHPWSGVTARVSHPMIRHGHVPALDGLRGVAILAVMLFHLITACGYGSDAWVTRKIIGLTVGLWSGVDLFFALSGFLITGILLRARDQPSYFKNFYMRRALRIFPLYYAALIAIFVVLPYFVVIDTPAVQRVYDAQGWLWAYSEDVAIFVHNEDFFDPDWLWVGHFWSLAVEEHFYLVWPLIGVLLPPPHAGAGLAVLDHRHTAHSRPDAVSSPRHGDDLHANLLAHRPTGTGRSPGDRGRAF